MCFGDYYGAQFRSWKIVISLVLLIAPVAADVSGEVIGSKFVCNGDSIILFKEPLIRFPGKEVALFVDKDGLIVPIATWTSSNGFTFEKHPGKVFRDGHGNLWIGSIDQTDEGTYTMQHLQDRKIIHVYHQDLTVLVAPTTNCKPIIKRTDSTLVAILEDTDCGKPEPSVYFMQYPHMSYASKTVAMLSSGNEAGTYIACMETPALRCVASLKPTDFCTYFTITENKYERTSTDKMKEIQIVVILNLITTFIVMAVMISYTILCIKRNSSFHFQPALTDQQKSSTHQGSQKIVDLHCFPQRENQPLIHETGSLSLQAESVRRFDLRARKISCKDELKGTDKPFWE